MVGSTRPCSCLDVPSFTEFFLANGDLSVLLFRFGLFRFGSTKLYLVFFTEFSCSRTLVGSTWPCRYLVVPSFTEFWGFFWRTVAFLCSFFGLVCLSLVLDEIFRCQGRFRGPSAGLLCCVDTFLVVPAATHVKNRPGRAERPAPKNERTNKQTNGKDVRPFR